VLLFRRIFDFQKSNVPHLEQRHNQRYAPGREFPLQARLHADAGDWPGRVLNISASGIGLLLERAIGLTAGQACRLHLELDQYELDLDVRLAHAETHADGWHYGLTLSFADFPLQKTYLQLLQPISIGCSLKPVTIGPFAQNDLPLAQYSFQGDAGSKLTLWRDKPPATSLHHFEFLLPGYIIKADVQARKLAVSLRPPDPSNAGKSSMPPTELSDDTKADVRQLYRWIVPNLPESLPAEARAFLQTFAH